MQRFTLAALAALMALGIAACAAAAPDDRHRTLEGEIHIKGNEPFPTAILETASHDSWELVGLPMDEARALQGRKVKVEGTVIQAPGPGVWLPSVRVQGVPQPVGR